jgi:hypothetical protein
VITCTQPGCRDQARAALRWSEQISQGWEMTNDRALCNLHADAVISELGKRGIHPTVKGLQEPLI